MCYHTIQTKLALQIENRFNAQIENKQEFAPHEHVNGFEFPKTPIITNENPEIIAHYNWGLIPHWAKNDEIKAWTLNAKIETAAEKPSFRDVIIQRCLVIANGFYEWQWLDSAGKNKVKYEIKIDNNELFAFAGLYSHWRDNITGEVKNTYTIVTTEANELMAKIHNIKKRMPVILSPEDESKWLGQAALKEFAFPYTVNLVAKKTPPHQENLSLFP